MPPASRTSSSSGSLTSTAAPSNKKRRLAPSKSQSSLLNFFPTGGGGGGGGNASSSGPNPSASSRSWASSTPPCSHAFGRRTKSREEVELEWAIQESLKDVGGGGGQLQARQGTVRNGDVAQDHEDTTSKSALDDEIKDGGNPTSIVSSGMATATATGEVETGVAKAPSTAATALSSPSMPRPTVTVDEAQRGPASVPSKSTTMPPTTAPSPLTPMRPISDFAFAANTIVGTSSSSSSSVFSSSSSTNATSNAFSKLMSTHHESKLWASADVIERENRYGAGRTRSSLRNAPFYKVLTGMPISVDAFRFGRIEGCRAYFLTHFHSDHYGGLTSSWSHGPIYCSKATANLVRTSLRVSPEWIVPLPMDVPCEIPNTGGVRVTLLDANHCPGSSLFLFQGPQTIHILPSPPGASHPPLPHPSKTFRYLHCGDFRASPRHLRHPAIEKGGRIDTVYLDTTYLNPRYCFPAQEQVVKACAQLVRELAPRGQIREADERREKEEEEEMVERWREGDGVTVGKKEEEEEDWRNPPLRGKALQAANEAVKNAPSVRALKGWLGGEKGKRSGEDAEVKLEGGKDENDGLDADEEDAWALAHGDELGDAEMEFRDEERMGEEVEEEDIEEGNTSRAVKEEPDDGVEPLGHVDKPSFEDRNVKKELADDDGEMKVRAKVEQLDEEEEKLELQGPLKADVKEDPNSRPLALDTKPPVAQRMLTDVINSRNCGSGSGSTTSKSLFPNARTSSSTNSNANANGDGKGKLLVVVGTYTIGKEKIVLSCARALRTKIFCMDSRKYRVYAQLEDHPELHRLLTRDPLKACVHVTNLQAIGAEGLRDHVALMRSKGLDIQRAVAFRPTGWTYRPPSGMDTVSPSLERVIAWNQAREFDARGLYPTRDSSEEYRIYGVPYSEHSSFFELTSFALSLDYGRMIATVNVGSASSRAKMNAWFEKWKKERRRRGERAVEGRSLDYF